MIYNSQVCDLVVFGLNRGLSCSYPSISYAGLFWFVVCFPCRKFNSKDWQFHLRPLGLARTMKGSREEVSLGDDVCGIQLMNRE